MHVVLIRSILVVRGDKMNELTNDISKYRKIARTFDAMIIMAIAIFFIWQLSPAFRTAVKLAILRTGIDLPF